MEKVVRLGHRDRRSNSLDGSSVYSLAGTDTDIIWLGLYFGRVVAVCKPFVFKHNQATPFYNMKQIDWGLLSNLSIEITIMLAFWYTKDTWWIIFLKRIPDYKHCHYRLRIKSEFQHLPWTPMMSYLKWRHNATLNSNIWKLSSILVL